MLGIDHQVRVFVFQVLESGVEFLLLRHKPAEEWPFGPVVGVIRPEEHMQDTVVRRVQMDTGIDKPTLLTDLAVPGKELFGDVGLVEWPFAYQAGSPHAPVAGIHPGPDIGAFAWMNFAEAYQSIGNDRDRECLVRLQVELQS